MVSPRTRQVLYRSGLAAGTALAMIALGQAVATAIQPGPRPRYRRWPDADDDQSNLPPELGPGILDIESEESDEEPPPGIQYADDEPCEVPPNPWELPVSSPYGGKVGESGCVPPADLEPIQKTEVPFAEGGERPGWPLMSPTDANMKVSYEDVRGLFHGKWGREFGATRKSTNKETGETYKRVHVGVDLFADDGDIVVASEPGEVIAALPYYKGLGAVYVLNDSGIIVNYGELKMNSWKPFGIKVGDRVEKGQRLARVGTASDGSHMLHLETFTPDTTVQEIRQGELRWIAGDPPPPNVLDPTRFLVRARQATLEDQEA